MSVLQSQIQRALGDAYVVEHELGGGGMSQVFVARDTALGRRVVVKVLLPELAEGLSVERFRREIQLAVALQHPHIVPVLSAGESDGLPYFIMPFVEGESLRARLALGPLSVPEAVRILRDVARALAYAHGQGVVHRDIKPENVLLTAGAAVVADFGVAKAFTSALRTAARPAPGKGHTLTMAGTALGTPRYMAPEQATADPRMDHRADLYAFGIMAYEMLTGAPPFTSTTPHELLAAHLTTTPPPMREKRANLPVALVELISRCLEKAPDDRPQSAQEIVEALDDPAVVSGAFTSGTANRALRRLKGRTPWGIGLAALTMAAAFGVWRVRSRPAGPVVIPARTVIATLPSVAVLPFVNIGQDSTDAYLAEGLTEEVTTALGALKGVRVVPRTLASSAREAATSLDSIGIRLGVTSILEGTVQRAGKQLRVTARLVNTSDGTMTWSDMYDANLTDVFAVQRQISQSIADALGNEFAPTSGAVGAVAMASPGKEPSPAAYGAYLRGRFLFQQRGADALRQAIVAFQEAIRADSTFGAPEAGMAQAMSQLPHYDAAIADSAWRSAIAHADRAISLDSSLGIAWAARGAAQAGQWEWARAEADLRHATQVTPGDPSPYQWLGELLLVLGRTGEAVQSLSKAAAADPTSPVIAASLAYARSMDGDFAAAISGGTAAVARDPTLWLTHFMLGATYLNAGQIANATRELETAQRLPGGNVPLATGMLGYAYGRDGDRARATAILRELERGAAGGRYAMPVAHVALGLGDTTTALDWMERGVTQHESVFAEEPLTARIFDALRGSARFEAIIRRLGLDPAIAQPRTR